MNLYTPSHSAPPAPAFAFACANAASKSTAAGRSTPKAASTFRMYSTSTPSCAPPAVLISLIPSTSFAERADESDEVFRILRLERLPLRRKQRRSRRHVRSQLAVQRRQRKRAVTNANDARRFKKLCKCHVVCNCQKHAIPGFQAIAQRLQRRRIQVIRRLIQKQRVVRTKCERP
uniref:Uncharacterized protein n=1 Tax=Pycnococcus provasolii TaxID=41880 RepID=A0A7S2FB44_9CHLO